MISINPYLNFPGNTEEAFNFYKSVFGGEFIGGISRFAGTPDGENLSAADKEKVMHVALPVGKTNILMATDALESMGQKVQPGNNIHLSVSTESEAEADKIYEALVDGGTATMPLAHMFWGAYFGMCIDKFGISWMVGYDKPKA